MDCYGFLDIGKEKAIIFAPKLDPLYQIWMTVLTLEDYAAKYELEVRNITELPEFMATECPSSNTTVYVNHGVNSDSGLVTQIPDQQYLENAKIDKDTMHDILAEARTVKNDEEILAMRWASQITSEAHCNVMKNCKPGMRESQLESFFDFHG